MLSQTLQFHPTIPCINFRFPWRSRTQESIVITRKRFDCLPDYVRQLQAKIPQEHAKAQQALRAGNKSEAQLCLTRRKLMENEVRRSFFPSVWCVKV